MQQESRGGSGDRDFSVVLSLFLRRRKNRKTAKTQKTVQKLLSEK
jgi:hypothetical protein